MPRVRLCYFAHIAERMGVKEEELLVEDGTTLGELLLERIPMEHPGVAQELVGALFEVEEDGVRLDEEGNPVLSGRYLVLVNGRSYPSLPEGLRYELKDGDVISMFPPLGGG